MNDIHKVNQIRANSSALLLIDAVHYAPHFPIDVDEIDCDFLLCSAYKFYGPHIGILYSKPGLLDALEPFRLRTQNQKAPYRIETGTLNHAALCGVSAAIDFIASQGGGESKRAKCFSGMMAISAYESLLFERFYNGLYDNPKISLFGPGLDEEQRAPTLSFLYEGKSAKEVCDFLATQNINAWYGHFYAIRATEVFDLLEKGGLTRLGISVYITEEEIKKTISALQQDF